MSDTPRIDGLWRAGHTATSGVWDEAKAIERELNDALHENGNLRQHIELLKYQIKVLSEEISAGP